MENVRTSFKTINYILWGKIPSFKFLVLFSANEDFTDFN